VVFGRPRQDAAEASRHEEWNVSEMDDVDQLVEPAEE
jgi:hypothetical protein